MKRQYLTTLAVVVAVIAGIGLCGCKKEGPVKEDSATTESLDKKSIISMDLSDFTLFRLYIVFKWQGWYIMR